MKLREEGRVGRFKISSLLIEDLDDEKALRFMGNFFIVRAEHMYASAHIEYTAYSSLFGVVDQGELIPFYNIEICTDGSLKAHRTSD